MMHVFKKRGKNIPKELILGVDKKAVLAEYIDRIPDSGEVKVKSVFWAQKHGTEMNFYQLMLFHNFIMMTLLIFLKKGCS
jgi:hypothetical protein